MRSLVAAAVCRDAAALRRDDPELWREVRRFPTPVQLALAAADRVARRADDLASAAVVSIAPSRCGSPELLGWVRAVYDQHGDGELGALRMNPTHTLHAVDNLALSAFAIRHGHRAYALGLGGIAGQAWQAIEVALSRKESEVLVMAGDQAGAATGADPVGVALLLAAGSRRGCRRIASVAWRGGGAGPEPEPAHAAAGLTDLLVAMERGATAFAVRDGGGEARVVLEP